MIIDFWYGNKCEDITALSVNFYPNDGIYRGNLYAGRRCVGDFVTTDSNDIYKYFPWFDFD